MKLLLSGIFSFIMLCSINGQNDQDKRDIMNIVQSMSKAWTDGDGTAWAEVFTDDHDYVTWFGLYMPGINRKINAFSHQQIFDSVYEDTQHFAVVDKIRFIDQDVALVHVLAAVNRKGEARPQQPAVLITLVMQNGGGNWKIVSLHNVDLEILENEQLSRGTPVPLSEMFGSWNSSVN